MDEKKLVQILSDGTLKDNSSYSVNGDNLLCNNNIKYHIKWKRQGEHKKPWNDENKIWEFLNSIENISKKSDETNIKLITFDSNRYEHNTDDTLFDLSGKDIRSIRIQIGNIVGYLKKGDYAIKISSRFGDSFLKAIISAAEGFLEVKNSGSAEKNKSQGFEWLLIYLWRIKLMKATLLGLPKQYITKDEKLTRPKGNLDVVNFYQSFEKGKYRCRYREHSYDNSVTRLIAATFNKVSNHEFVNDMHLTRNIFLTSTMGKKTKPRELLQTKHITNTFYKDYNDVVDLSKYILKNEYQEYDGEKETSAFLFDISMLFEYFIRKVLKNAGFILESKKKTDFIIPTGGDQKRNRNLEPDILILHKGNTYLFDVKYKHFDTRNGVKREDLFQIHTYLGQIGNTHNIDSCGFIYPISQKDWDNNTLIKESNGVLEKSFTMMGRHITLYVILFKVPNEDNGLDYKNQFSDSIEHFINKSMMNILN